MDNKNLLDQYNAYVAGQFGQAVAPFHVWIVDYKNSLQEKLNDIRVIQPISIDFVEATREIQDMAIIAQNNGKATIFTTFSGHIQQFDLRVYTPIWQAGKDASFTLAFIDEIGTDYDAYVNKARQFFISL